MSRFLVFVFVVLVCGEYCLAENTYRSSAVRDKYGKIIGRVVERTNSVGKTTEYYKLSGEKVYSLNQQDNRSLTARKNYQSSAATKAKSYQHMSNVFMNSMLGRKPK